MPLTVHQEIYCLMKNVSILILSIGLALDASAQHPEHNVQPQPDAANAAPAKSEPHSGHETTPSVTRQHTGHVMPKMTPLDLSPQPTIDPSDAEYYPYDMKSMGSGRFGMLLFDQLEYRLHEGADLLRWDSEGWYGSDFNRFWFRTEGEQTLQGPSSGFSEFHGYYGRLVAPFWDAQMGLRYDQQWEPGNDSSRLFGAIGLQGFAPYRFEIAPTLFVSEDGDVSARFTATQDYRLTQRLVAQPRFETQLAVQDVPGFGVGSGFNYVELGLRLRYEFRREFAPYIGINWERKVSGTESLARQAGEDPDVLSFVAGLRLWF